MPERGRTKRGNIKSFLFITMLHHTVKLVHDSLEALSREVLPHTPYSPDLTPSDCHLFASMGHALAGQLFGWYEDVKKWTDEWFATKGENFTGVNGWKIGKMHKKEWSILWIIILSNLKCIFLEKGSAFHTCTPGIHNTTTTGDHLYNFTTRGERELL